MHKWSQKERFSEVLLSNLKLFTIIILICVMFVQTAQICFAADTSTNREDQVRHEAQKILSRSEFSYQKHDIGFIEKLANNLKSVIDHIKEKIKQLFKKLSLKDKISSMDSPITNSNLLILKVIGILVLVILIAGLFILLLRNLKISRKVKEQEDAELLSTLKEPDLVISQAVELSKSGDYRLALRLLYIGMLLKLNEFNLIRIGKSKVNRQYLNELKDNGFDKYEKVLEFTGDFNRYWYGNRSLNQERFDYWLAEYTSIKEAIVK